MVVDKLGRGFVIFPQSGILKTLDPGTLLTLAITYR